MISITRFAVKEDIAYITEIYNQGIEDRVATLETALRSESDMEKWLLERDKRHRVLVLEDMDGKVNGWASLNVFNPRACYSGVADISIYLDRSMRGKGLGKILLSSLIEAAQEEGFHKLVLSTFNFNVAGKNLYKSAGFREVGTYKNHGKLDGKWVDVTIMELLLEEEQESKPKCGCSCSCKKS